MTPKRLTVLGNAAQDTAYRLQALPRPGETIIAQSITQDLGGKGFNQAVAAARAGARPVLVAPVGEDAIADDLARTLAAEAVTDRLIRGSGRSDSAVILVDRHGENTIVSDTGQIEALDFDAVRPLLPLGPHDLLLMQGNLSQAATSAALAHARKAGAMIALNPSPLRPWLAGADIDLLIANRLEAALWSGLPQDAAPTALIGALALPMAIVTLGAEGAMLRIGGDIHIAPAPRIEALDTTGAGDVLAGVFCALLSSGMDPARALRVAVGAASLQTLNEGTLRAMPSRAAIAALIEEGS
jgi:ribokinase